MSSQDLKVELTGMTMEGFEDYSLLFEEVRRELLLTKIKNNNKNIDFFHLLLYYKLQ